MPLGHFNLQFLNHNSQRSYPLTSRATKTDLTGTITIPDNFLVGLYFTVPAATGFEPENFFLKTLLISPVGYGVVLAYDNGVSTVDVAAANIVRAIHTPNQSYALTGIGAFDDCVGSIVLGVLDDIDLLTPGFYTFDKEGGELEQDCLKPMLRGVSRLRVTNSGASSQYIYGDVVLIAGTNMRINVATAGDTTEITFDAIDGANLNTDCLCSIPPVGECIRCINGVCSDDGTFIFAQDDCVEITPIINGLQFRDTCATPCCGCSETEAIRTQLDRLNDGVATLQGFVGRLGGEVSQMSMTVIASRVIDGCNVPL